MITLLQKSEGQEPCQSRARADPPADPGRQPVFGSSGLPLAPGWNTVESNMITAPRPLARSLSPMPQATDPTPPHPNLDPVDKFVAIVLANGFTAHQAVERFGAHVAESRWAKLCDRGLLSRNRSKALWPRNQLSRSRSARSWTDLSSGSGCVLTSRRSPAAR